MLIRNTCCFKKEMSQVFVVIYGIPLFSKKKIDFRMQNSVKILCIPRSLLAELWFSKKNASFLENRVCKKGQVKVTLFPGMVFQERILFFFFLLEASKDRWIQVLNTLFCTRKLIFFWENNGMP